MRNTLIKYISHKAHKDKRIYTVIADIGDWLFRSAGFPKHRLINVGVAEQNMINVATGLALRGKRVFCYTIAPFATCRCYDQIRYSVAYHNLPITIVGVGAGLCYSKEGPSHHAIEDIAIMRALPNMHVYSPACPEDVKWVLQDILSSRKPAYLRLQLSSEPLFMHANNVENDIAILYTGRIFSLIYKAVEGIKGVSLHNIVILKPIYEKHYINILNSVKNVITIEEHSIIGGLGDIVANIIAKYALNISLHKIGIDDTFVPHYGDNEYVLEQAGLTVKRIKDEIKNCR